MKIESYTYFEQKVDPNSGLLGCSVAFGLHSPEDILINNPPFILVENNLGDGVDDDIIYVDNIHEYDLPVKNNEYYEKYPYMLSVGFWRVKYKHTC